MKKSFFKDYLFIASAIALGVISVVLTAAVFKTDKKLFAFVAPVVFILVAAIEIKIFSFVRNGYKAMAKLSSRINLLEKDSLYGIPVSMIIVSGDRQILWYNKKCRHEIMENCDFYGLSLDNITDQPIDKLCRSKTKITFGGKYYEVYAKRDTKDGEELAVIYFIDITELVLLEEEHKLSKPNVLLITVDNYEELFTDVKESEKAYLSGEIEKLLENFISPTHGVLRKYNSNTFMAVVEERHLRKMIESKFKILDLAREIKVENRMGATLSIGVGRVAENLEESEKFARQALDMALGRGGDQAAVKTANGFDFYGGVSRGIEKQTKVKTRIIATAVRELIQASDRVFIMGHRFGDLDSLGSSVGLARVARNMGKEAYIAVDRHKILAGPMLAKIEQNTDGKLFLAPHDAVDIITKKSLLIVVDTHNPEILESQKLYAEAEKVVVIDHHRKMVNHIDKAVIFYHEPMSSSASEMVAELIQYLGDDGKISPIEAEALLAGITLDTKNFGLRTGVRTFEAAAYLRKQGADTSAVRGLFSNSLVAYQRKTRIIASTEIYKKCAIAASDANMGADIQTVAPQAADEMLSISGVDASFVLYPINDAISISARSMGAINVQVIMEYLGGGGHQTMSGAQLKGASMQKARQSLLEAIDKYYESRTD
ncbi:MAG: DHH family phosphoesterase [Oscillospiraceae bacterium]